MCVRQNETSMVVFTRHSRFRRFAVSHFCICSCGLKAYELDSIPNVMALCSVNGVLRRCRPFHFWCPLRQMVWQGVTGPATKKNNGRSRQTRLCSDCEFGVEAGFCRKASALYVSENTIRNDSVRLFCQNYLVGLHMSNDALIDWTIGKSATSMVAFKMRKETFCPSLSMPAYFGAGRFSGFGTRWKEARGSQLRTYRSYEERP